MPGKILLCTHRTLVEVWCTVYKTSSPREQPPPEKCTLALSMWTTQLFELLLMVRSPNTWLSGVAFAFFLWIYMTGGSDVKTFSDAPGYILDCQSHHLLSVITNVQHLNLYSLFASLAISCLWLLMRRIYIRTLWLLAFGPLRMPTSATSASQFPLLLVAGCKHFMFEFAKKVIIIISVYLFVHIFSSYLNHSLIWVIFVVLADTIYLL